MKSDLVIDGDIKLNKSEVKPVLLQGPTIQLIEFKRKGMWLLVTNKYKKKILKEPTNQPNIIFQSFSARTNN